MSIVLIQSQDENFSGCDIETAVCLLYHIIFLKAAVPVIIKNLNSKPLELIRNIMCLNPMAFTTFNFGDG